MILERTLPQVWALSAADVPALSGRGRDRVVLVADTETLCASIVVDSSRSEAPYVPRERVELYDSLGFLLGQTWLVLPKYDPTRGESLHDPYAGGFRGWLHTELVRDLIDHWRSWRGRNGQKVTSAAELDLERFVVDEGDREDPEIRAILGRLDKRHRVVARLLLEGKSVTEIAEWRGVSRPAASKYIGELKAALVRLGISPTVVELDLLRSCPVEEEALAA